jgi:glycosyltransferase involved in cell wall biosynthesis
VTDREPPRTTVVIPVWDAYAGQRLLDAVATVAEQDRPAHIVLVDNASSLELPPVGDVEVIRSTERISLGAARNRGLAAVTTANVIFWDADDLMLPGTIGFLEDELGADSGLVAFGAAIVEDPSGMRHRWPRRWIVNVIPHQRVFALVDGVWSMFPTTGATLMRTDVVRACGGFGDANSGEDWSLGAALVWRGRVGWSERPGRRYLQHEGSSWNLFGSPRHQLENARAVRHRLVSDPGLPKWVHACVPLLGLLQISAVAAHSAAARLKRLARRARASDAT